MCYLKPALIVATLAALDAVAAPLNPELLFKDTFDSANPSDDINADNAARQSGLTAPLTYTTAGNAPQLGQADAANQVRLASNSHLSPNHNFTEGAKFTIEFDVDPGIDDLGSPLSGDWCAVVFGSSGQNQFVTGSDGVGFLFRNNGDIQVFDGGAATYGGPGIAGGMPKDRVFHVRLEAQTTAFGTGPATVQMFVDDQPVQIAAGNATTLTKAAGFKNNYVTLEGYGFPGPWTHVFDNLSISAVPDIQVAPRTVSLNKQLTPTSDPVTVTVPAQVVAGGAAQVKVKTSNTAVATPTGANASGELTLDFAQGVTTRTFTVTAVAPGIADITLEGPADVGVAGGVQVFISAGITYDEALFTDPFTVSAGSFDINIEAATRQTGTLKPLNYREGEATAPGGPADDFTQVSPAEASNALLIVNQGGGVSPDHNFIEGAEFTVSADVHPDINGADPASDNWAAIVIGNSTPNSFVISQDGFGVLFRINGAIEVWDAGTRVYGSAVGILPAPPFNVKLAVSALNFAGAPATISLKVNDQTVALTGTGDNYVKTAGFRNNYITLEGVGDGFAHVFDNFKVDAKARIVFASRSVETTTGRTESVIVKVPAGLIANGPATVKVKTSNPAVATLTGAVAGELTLTFAQGGPLTHTVNVEVKGVGQARLELVHDGGAAVGEPFTLNSRAGLVKNPSFESNYNPTFPSYSDIDLWPKTGGTGVNQARTGPFADNGSIPDGNRVAFLQGAASIAQVLSGLEPGKQYWVQFFYNARGCCGGTIDASVKFNDVEVGLISNLRSVGGINAYEFASFAFTPSADTGELKIQTTANGDATAVIDAVTVVRRDLNPDPADTARQHVIMRNPSFEASGDVAFPGYLQTLALGGWNGTGQFGVNFTGAGPFADNGTAADQDNVAFLQGVSSLSQQVPRLIVGQRYDVTVAYNARSGNTPHLLVKADDIVLIDEDVAPVGGGAAYRTKTVSFTATGTSTLLSLAQTKEGDETVLLDNISIVGRTISCPCIQTTPGTADLAVGQNGTVTVNYPVTCQTGFVKLRSANPAVASLVGAAGDGILTLTFNDPSAPTQTFDILGVARGGTAIEVVDSGGLCVNNGVNVNVVTSFVRNPSFEGNPAGAFPGYGSINAWTGGSGLNKRNADGPFADNGVIPDREQVAFVQGGSTLSQQVLGLTPGKLYWLQFRYNVRNCCAGGTMDLGVRFDGVDLTAIPTIAPVGGDNPYYVGHVEFTPANATGLLEFVTTASGDATVTLDAVNIVQRDAGQLALINPSFEAEGAVAFPGYLQPNRISGWDGLGNYGVNVSGVGPFADNGVNPDQDTVAFIQGQGASLSQTLTGLTAGENYTVSFSVNARGGNAPQLAVSFGGTVILDEAITPVGGTTPYPVKTAVFTASAAEGVLKFEQTAAGDNTLAFDNVTVKAGGTVVEPPPTLRATRTAEGNIRLSWPTNAAGWALNSAAPVNGAYSPVNDPVVVEGTDNVVIVPASATPTFYRLTK